MSQNPSYQRLSKALTSIIQLSDEVRFPSAPEESLDLKQQVEKIRGLAEEALKPEPLIEDIDPTRKDRDPLDYAHIDDFLDDPLIRFKHPELRYVNFFLSHARKSASDRMAHEPYMAHYQLFVDYEGKTYQVVGASRLGDVWLAESFKKDAQYTLRVAPDFRKFSNWRDKANWRLSLEERMILAKAVGGVGEPKRGVKVKVYLDNWMRSNGIPEWYSDTTAEQRTTLRVAKEALAEEERRRREDTNYRA